MTSNFRQRPFFIPLLSFALLCLIGLSSPLPSPIYAAPPTQSQATPPLAPQITTISPYWPNNIQQWGSSIVKVGQTHGIDPDLVAAVVFAESGGEQDSVSRVGAVGLMGVMPTSPGLEWRPSSEDLVNPGLNLRWGVAILGDIIRQSGGDISAALAAYSGGWHNATRTVPRQYATQVIDSYSRAVLVRTGYSPEIADRWTLALEINYGHVSNESLLITGEQQPLSGLHTYVEHMIYNHTDSNGHAYRIKAYVVPIAYVVPSPQPIPFGQSDTIETDLDIRLGTITAKESANPKSPRVIIACLASISRLRGQESTRWFAPSSCPAWHR